MARRACVLVMAICSMAAALAFAAPPDPRATAEVDRGLEISKTKPNSDEEAACYQKAAQIDPNYASAWFNLGFVRMKQGKAAEALSSFEKTIRLDPKRADAFFNAGNCAAAAGKDPATIRSYFNKFLELAEQGAKSDPRNIAQAKESIKTLEAKIADSNQASVADMTKAEDIVGKLKVAPTRGASPYSGGRIPIKILFDTNKADIRSDQIKQLDEIVAALQNPALAGRKITIEGHTDSDGSSDYNQALSEKRAKAIRDYVVGKGIDAGRLAFAGCGEDKPLRPNDTAENKQANRRVELVSQPAP